VEIMAIKSIRTTVIINNTVVVGIQTAKPSQVALILDTIKEPLASLDQTQRILSGNRVVIIIHTMFILIIQLMGTGKIERTASMAVLTRFQSISQGQCSMQLNSKKRSMARTTITNTIQ
jgi:hypothetical protein